MTDPHDRTLSSATWLPLRAGCLAAGTGALAILGWRSGLFLAPGHVPGSLATKPATAVGLLVVALALVLSAGRYRRPAAQRVALLAASLGACLGAAALCEALLHRDFGLEAWIANAVIGSSGPGVAARMAPTTALSLVLTGISVICWNRRKLPGLAQGLALLTGAMALLSLASHLYGAGPAGATTRVWHMSIPAATAFLGLALGILALGRDRGLVASLLSERPAGALARRQAEAQLHATQARHAYLFESNLIGAMSGDLSGRILEANDAFLNMVGYTRADLPLRWDLMTPPELLPRTAQAVADLRSGGSAAAFEKEYIRKDGTRVPVLVGSAILPGATDQWAAFVLDLTERRKAEQEQARAARQIAVLNRTLAVRAGELEAANKELEAFSYSVSHDLRAPLRHIDGFADLLKRNDAASLSDTGRRYLDTISAAARRMGELIDDLLVFSRMGRDEMQKSRVRLRALVDEVVGDLGSELSGRRVEWRIGPLPDATGDPAMLRVVLTNLISNALKYSSKRPVSVVEIGADSAAGEIIFYVRDNGVGFDEQYAHKLFGVFQRLHSTDEFEGTGIGLANVRRVVHRHGGRTWASGQLDRGATFFFSLPGGGELSPPAPSSTGMRSTGDPHAATGTPARSS